MIATRTELLSRAAALVHGRERVILAVVGPPGSGKSTIAELIVNELALVPPEGAGADWVAHLPMDGYHFADVQLDRLGRRQRKGAIDTFDAAGYVATLRRLAERTDDAVYVPGFERELEQPIAASIAISRESSLIVTEGLYLLHDQGEWAAAAGYFIESWYCVVDHDTRIQRLIDRHVRFGKRREEATAWVANVDEKNTELVERSRSRATAMVDINAVGESLRAPS